MKKQYMAPATEWVIINKVTILSGSGPGAGDITNPGISSSRRYNDIWDDDDDDDF